MNQAFKKLVSTLALATLIFVSVVSVCKQMTAAEAQGCTHPMNATHMSLETDVCGQNMTAASAIMQDHMTTFAGMYPGTTTSAASLLFAAGVAILLAWFLTRDARSDHECFRAKLKSLEKNLLRTVAPDFLVLAFRRGILNAKIYA